MCRQDFLSEGIKKEEFPKKFLFAVRVIGLEPTRLTTPDPKSGVATNYTTRAHFVLDKRLQRYGKKMNIQTFSRILCAF